jgi:UDP-N-acetylmuramate dehydrogenase
VFKNPTGGSAGALIDRSGLKGTRVGEAVVSDVHANFIVNAGAARFDDVVALIERVRAGVSAASGVGLELEVKVWR